MPRRLVQAMIDVGGPFVVFFVLLNVGVVSGQRAWLWAAFAVLILGSVLIQVVLARRGRDDPQAGGVHSGRRGGADADRAFNRVCRSAAALC